MARMFGTFDSTVLKKICDRISHVLSSLISFSYTEEQKMFCIVHLNLSRIKPGRKTNLHWAKEEEAYSPVYW